MVREKAAQISALVIIVLCFVLRVLPIDIDSVGLYHHCCFANRLIYHFIHVGWIHLIANSWFLLCIVFLYRITPVMMMESFVIASSFPCSVTSLIGYTMLPTVGLSGFIYALLGLYSSFCRLKIRYHAWFLFFILIGFFISGGNALLHLYCYLLGTCWSMIKYYRYG